MKIIPVGQKILVKPLEAKESKSSGGIIIPESVAVADLREAVVVEVSKELSHKYTEGDIVLYPSKSGLGQGYNGTLHLWLREDIQEIWGVSTN
jgi:co-chaperonin GroES (HSP10)